MSSRQGPTLRTCCLALAVVGAALVAGLPSCSSNDPQIIYRSRGDSGADSASPEDDASTQPDGQKEDDPFKNPIIEGAPSNAPALFEAANAGEGTGPCLYEPELGTLFPKNWLRPRFRYTTANDENLYEIKVVIPGLPSALRVYTTDVSYTMEQGAWAKITSVAAGKSLHVTVRSAVYEGGGLTGGPWLGSEGDIEIAPVEAAGSVVYWATAGGFDGGSPDSFLKGFRVGDESVEEVVTLASAKVDCIACHTATPDGAYAGMTVTDDRTQGGDSPAYLKLLSVDGKSTEPPFLTDAARTMLKRKGQHLPSFSRSHWTAGDRTMLSMWRPSAAPTSEIAWTDLEAGSTDEGTGWGIIARNGDPQSAAGASFSHDGNTIVYISTPNDTDSGTNTKRGLLYTVPYNDRAGGDAQPISGADDPAFHYFHPSFSADDQLIAFSRIPQREDLPITDWINYGYNNPATEVFVVPTAGGDATRLAANDPPACLKKTSPGLTNSWPKWSPEAKTDGDKTYYFIVFSSTRNPTSNGGAQLYVAPIVVSAGSVSSYPALYLWNQEEGEHNHTPAWDNFNIPTIPK